MKIRLSFAFLLTITLYASNAFAQLPDAGSILVGGTVGTLNFSTKNTGFRTTAISGTPQVGVMLTRKLALGLGIPLAYSQVKTQGITAVSAELTTTQIGVAPFARYYITQTQVRPYLTASASQTWFHSTVRATQPVRNEQVKDSFVNYFAGAGIAYFVNRNVSLDLTAVYHGGDEPVADIGSQSISWAAPQTVSVQLGFQIFL